MAPLNNTQPRPEKGIFLIYFHLGMEPFGLTAARRKGKERMGRAVVGWAFILSSKGRKTMKTTRVKDFMEDHIEMIPAMATLQDAARKMEEADCGFLPVGTPGKPEGIITDRDIVIRAVAKGKDPAKEKVKDYMTHSIHTCAKNLTLEEAASLMNEKKVGRLVVQDESGKACGVLSFGRIIRKGNNPEEVSSVVQCATGKAA